MISISFKIVLNSASHTFLIMGLTYKYLLKIKKKIHAPPHIYWVKVSEQPRKEYFQ